MDNNFKTLFLSLLCLGSSLGLASQPKEAVQEKAVYLDVNAPLEQRVEDALKRMTLEEKVAVVHAQSKFSSAGVPRLGIPENWMSDGPHGIRNEVLWDEWYGANWTNDSCIAFPALTALAASWNPDMASLYGTVIGEEARYRNKNVLLGPGVNIYRTPLNGRNFEYMGEDPYLASTIVVPYVQGVQSNGVAACVKHFAINNQEVDRHIVNVIVSDRALHEIYLPAFKAAVDGGAWAIMGSYNKYKDQHCCHNEYLLNDILKKDWKFDGVVVSDWGGVHDTEQAAKNGLDMEFGSWTNGLNWGASNAYDSYYLALPYYKAIKEGKLSEDDLNDKVRRVLRLIFRTNMAPQRHFGSFGTKEHALAGRKIAEEGIVLLKNDNNVLPLDLNKVKNILVVGENAVKRMTIGGGSSSLKVKYEVSPLQGIINRVANKAKVTYVKGYESPAVAEQDKIGAKAVVNKIDTLALRQEAVEAAKLADVVIFIGGLNKNEKEDCEGIDRVSLNMSYEQDELISELAKANKNLAVVILSGNAVAMPWVNEVPAIVEGWYCGTEAGNALAAVIMGDVNPSGKLPFTFYKDLNDCSAHSVGEYPGDGKNVNYKEDIFVGYRYTDKQKNKPLFAFGHGLSYTTFEYGKLTSDVKSVSLDQINTLENGKAKDFINLSITVKNTGKVDGAEVVQLYVSDKKSSLPRPIKELKAYKKVFLKAGETATVNFSLNKDALSFYDSSKGEWLVEKGDFEVLVGAACDNIKSKVTFSVK